MDASCSLELRSLGAAGSLGSEQWSWDAHVISLDEDINPLNVPRYKERDLGLGGPEIHGQHAILGVRLHNPVDMSVLQRESPLGDAELLPCFLGRGRFASDASESDEDMYTATHWVSMLEMAREVVDYHPEIENENGDYDTFTRAMNLYT